MKRRLLFMMGAVLISASLSPAAIIGAFVAADGTNTAPSSALTTGSVTDNLWGFVTQAPTGSGQAGSAFFSYREVEDSPEINMTVTGLDNTETYNVYGLFWSWAEGIGVELGMQSGNLSYYNMSSTEAIDTGVGPWDGQNLYQVLLGQVSSATEATIYIDDAINQPSIDDRSYFVGMSYEVVPEPTTMAILFGGSALCFFRKRKNR